MNHESALRDAIAQTLATEVKAHSLVGACVRFGLAEGTDEEAWTGKARYVEARLSGKPIDELLAIGERVLSEYEDYKLHAFHLKEALRLARSGGKRRISEITRRNIIDEFALLGRIEGKQEIGVFLRKLWPIDAMASQDHRYSTFGMEVWQHMVRNDDWTPEHLLDRLGVMEVSDAAFSDLLELAVHPSVRQGDEQHALVATINAHLRNDRLVLTEASNISGYPVFSVRPTDAGVDATPKNLIFASSGPKPEIILADAIHNDVRVVKNADYCMFYDRPISEQGLLWSDLVAWWAESQIIDPRHENCARSLYRRLFRSLSSPPEQILFRAYYDAFKRLGNRLPALVPQVYVHFDPLTIKELYGEKRLARQRMDFLLLLPYGRRIVLEVDGVQHYADGEQPAPARYAEMVEADRQLRLCGYEVYRFGGAELPDKNGRVAVVFFERLFKKHLIG